MLSRFLRRVCGWSIRGKNSALAVGDAGAGFAVDAADDDGAFIHAGQGEAGLLEQVGGDDGDHADAHVEGAEHLVGFQFAEPLQVSEERWWVPGGEIDLSGEAAGKDARQVFGEAAAGDVGEAADDFGLDEFADRAEVAAVGSHEGCADLVAELVDVLVEAVAGLGDEDLLGERIAAGVEAVGGQGEQEVAVADGVAGEQARAADDAGEEAGELVVVGGVERGSLGGLAAEQGAAVGAAGIDEAGDDLLDYVGVEQAGGEVVEEEERCCALHGDVVNAVVDEVGGDGGVQAELGGELELAADAIGGGDQDGVGEAIGIQGEEAGEAADFGEDMLIEGAAGEALDAVGGEDMAVGGRDAGVFGARGTVAVGGWFGFARSGPSVSWCRFRQ